MQNKLTKINSLKHLENVEHRFQNAKFQKVEKGLKLIF